MFYRFADPLYLLLALAVPGLILWYWKMQPKKTAGIRFSHLGLVLPARSASTGRSRHLLLVLRIAALLAFVVAFARPQSGVTGEEILTEGIDILLVLDLSTSMLAEDISPNRVEASKQVAADFVRGRRNDRIGLVVFSGQAFTQCPLTLDYDIVLEILDGLEVGLIEDGTAIGMGIATAAKRLEESPAESRVIILITDGRNNSGEIDPITASQMAQSLGIRIYAIGTGSHGEAPYPVDDPVFGRRYAKVRVDIDEETLKKASEMTSGRYFRATNRESLEGIYEEIDELEKTEVIVNQYTRFGELFHYPLLMGLGLLLLEVGLANTKLRKIP